MSDTAQTRRSFIKGSMAKSLIAANAGIVAGLINTPGVAGANTTGPGTTQPQTTEGVSTFAVAHIKHSNPTSSPNISITVANNDLLADPDGTHAWVLNQLFQQLTGREGLIFVSDLRSNWKTPTGLTFPSVSAASMNFPRLWQGGIGAPPTAGGTTVFNFTAPITIIKAILVPKVGSFPSHLIEDYYQGLE